MQFVGSTKPRSPRMMSTENTEWPKKIIEDGKICTLYENIETAPELEFFDDRFLRYEIWWFILSNFRDKMREVYGDSMCYVLPNIFKTQNVISASVPADSRYECENELLHIYDFCTDTGINLIINGRRILIYHGESDFLTFHVSAGVSGVKFTCLLMTKKPYSCQIPFRKKYGHVKEYTKSTKVALVRLIEEIE